jgi:methionine-rich copper-binding protein CopC
MIRRLIAAALLATLAPVAPSLAHTTVEKTSPVSGSILPASPPEVTLAFHEPASLTSLVVKRAGKPDRKLAFMPSGASKSFMAHDPALGDGRNEIAWKALSKDGHVIEGSIIIVIKPGAAPSAPAKAEHAHDEHAH